MPTDIRAQVKEVPVSAQKVRLVIDTIRGKDALEALDILRFMQPKPAKSIVKLLRSAMANAEENFGISRDELFVYQIFADVGPTRKWRRFGARGRIKPWLRRSAHVTIVLREYEDNQ